MNPTWAKEVPARVRPPPPQPSPPSARLTAASWRPAKTAPLGVPVVPDVNTMVTGRSGSAGSDGGAWPGTRSPESTDPGARAGTTSTTVAPEGGWAGACSAVASTSLGPATARTEARSAGASRSLTPAVTAPSLAAAA